MSTPFLSFQEAIEAWPGTRFKQLLTAQLMQLNLDQIPLQKALSQGSFATLDNLQFTINNSELNEDLLTVRVGVFFSSILAGCNCSDDPSPVDLINEYCELELVINRLTGQGQFKLK
jgi:hypothetical protein